MKLQFAAIAAIGASIALASPAQAQRAAYEQMAQAEAQAHGVPFSLVHRVLMRESRYNARAIGRGGHLGLMQISHATARGLGYSGTREGLLDPATNLSYGVKYLAGAWRAANGNESRAVAYYASGYYYAAKRQRMARAPLRLTPQP
jgi:soluble lytic murein transglycosylase-like protein